ncbi:MAG: CPBP family intramembrane metalloprotease [Ignavibacteriae bacterium]|nr:CPBP family intramembrane metalloprotease [Ignavibacteriota bacterium]
MEDFQHPAPSIPIHDSLPHARLTFIERYGISPIVFGFLVLIVVFLLYQIVGGVITFLFFGIKPTPDNVVGYRMATGLGQIFLLLVPTIFLARFVSLKPSQFMRLKFPELHTLIPTIVGIFSLQQMLQIYLAVQEKIPLPESIQTQLRQIKELIEEVYKVLVSSNSLPELFYVILIVAFIPAIAEELFFRGLVQRSFEQGLSPVKGLLLTSLIFGAYHLNPTSFVPLAALGVYLGYLVLRSQSVWLSAFAHFCNNAFACVAVYLSKNDDYIVTGDPEEMSAVLLLGTFVSFGVIFFFSTYYFIQVTKPINLPHTSIVQAPS